jgi:RNA polymerase sigma factor (sigma-70 family)
MNERFMPSDQEFEKLVNLYYGDLYRFGFSLTQNEADAADLVQQTFYVWANKGYQLRLASNAKRWLLTTLYREFLQQYRRHKRFHEQLSENPPEQRYEVNDISQTDVQTMLDCLKKIHENYRAPLVLYYLEDLAYKEIAEVLAVPVGTVQSRIARGKSQLGQLLNGAGKKKERHFG